MEVESIRDRPDKDSVGYVFSDSDETSIQWVLSKRVSAAAIGSSDFLKIPQETRDQLVILAKTESVPRHLVMVSPTLTPEQVEAIRVALLAADKNKEGKDKLEGFEDTAKFDELPGGVEQSFARMRKLYELSK
ncbi:MAG: PhnD/SsuA/transferrin family substrate-binding protein [Cyanophyceae cyanobacterium]